MSMSITRAGRSLMLLSIGCVWLLQSCKAPTSDLESYPGGSGNDDAVLAAQMKKYDEQLKETDRQLEVQQEHLSRMSEILGRWEEQADRFDKILDHWEEQANVEVRK